MKNKSLSLGLILLLTLSIILLNSSIIMAEDSAEFDLEITILEPISIEITENIDFGSVFPGEEEEQVGTVEAIVEAAPDTDYSVILNNEDSQVILTSAETEDEITVDLEHDSRGSIGNQGEEDFEIEATIPAAELEVESGDYSGTAVITVISDN
ncbi:hypothetical protein [Fuchsiella alkaliacetigena]|uniref:hypothetical protein n=1 Tax=Fuchsiella alkaliacetigena TaxID=957042 RepID=UPI002009DDD9|nr:hypothetical protein [Fuchsiella alkaliacetigena]MCK8824766.1 hypothetical protein [Fuchsiella alkaliacetigena]